MGALLALCALPIVWLSYGGRLPHFKFRPGFNWLGLTAQPELMESPDILPWLVIDLCTSHSQYIRGMANGQQQIRKGG
jgi:hypothetical protein